MRVAQIAGDVTLLWQVARAVGRDPNVVTILLCQVQPQPQPSQDQPHMNTNMKPGVHTSPSALHRHFIYIYTYFLVSPRSHAQQRTISAALPCDRLASSLLPLLRHCCSSRIGQVPHMRTPRFRHCHRSHCGVCRIVSMSLSRAASWTRRWRSTRRLASHTRSPFAAGVG